MASLDHSQQVRDLRNALGLTQTQMGRVLGIAEKSLTRLERHGEWSDTMLRLVRAILECPLAELEALLIALPSGLDLATAPSDEDRALFARAASHLRIGARSGDRVRDALARRPRGMKWTYWATGAKADADETLTLACNSGIICRPLRSSAGIVPDYLTRLSPGDEILLCHNGLPRAWFTLRRAPLLGVRAPVPNLPPVFRLVPCKSSLGKDLASLDYSNKDGNDPSTSDAPFSCLSVAHLRPARGERPKSRQRGNRDAMTPYAEEEDETLR
jgi:DNA-binding XRE family transcriptional regulator